MQSLFAIDDTKMQSIPFFNNYKKLHFPQKPSQKLAACMLVVFYKKLIVN